ncbi:MAG: DUF3987 domain-containing protein [Gemmataceae bacterium]|nr:DUF3987 domain-containing protein [Gemmataceae bacterium]
MGTKPSIIDKARSRKANSHPGNRNGSAVDTVTALGDWPDPTPLGAEIQAPAFPREILPGPLAKLADEIAVSMNAPVDFPAVTMLALASGAIANSRAISPKRSYQESPTVFAGLIGRPGVVKSPVLGILRRAFDSRQLQLLAEWGEELAEWEKQPPDERGPKPNAQRILVSDTTTETLGRLIVANPRGLIQVRDELMELVAGLNQYKGGQGADRQFYLKIWSCDPLLIDRMSDKSAKGGPLYSPRSFCSIVGGLQPDVLTQFRQMKINDGFLDRWLWCYPEELPAAGANFLEVSDSLREQWAGVIDRLLALPMEQRDDGTTRPHYILLTTEARGLWLEADREIATALNVEEFPECLRGAWIKLRTYLLRLALILHCLRNALGESVGEYVDGESIRRAFLLVEYFQGHARKVYAAIDADKTVRAARKLLRWLPGCEDGRFKTRDAYRQLRGSLDKPADIEPILALLSEHDYIRAVPMPPTTGAGRKPSPVYEVNPRQ